MNIQEKNKLEGLVRRRMQDAKERRAAQLNAEEKTVREALEASPPKQVADLTKAIVKAREEIEKMKKELENLGWDVQFGGKSPVVRLPSVKYNGSKPNTMDYSKCPKEIRAFGEALDRLEEESRDAVEGMVTMILSDSPQASEIVAALEGALKSLLAPAKGTGKKK